MESDLGVGITSKRSIENGFFKLPVDCSLLLTAFPELARYWVHCDRPLQSPVCKNLSNKRV